MFLVYLATGVEGVGEEVLGGLWQQLLAEVDEGGPVVRVTGLQKT